MSVQAVIFDFGGVITSSPFEAFARYERERGLPADFIRRINAADPHANAWARFERAEIDAVFGRPLTVEPMEWPRGSAVIADTTKTIGKHLRKALAEAQELTGRELPGPLPKAAAS